MKSILITVCFEYKENRLTEFYKDANKVLNVLNFSQSILFTDSQRNFDNYDVVFKDPTIELFKETALLLDDIDTVCFFYITGHGIFSGFLWYDNSVFVLNSLFDDFLSPFIGIVDMCNAPNIEMPFLYDKEGWKQSKGKSKKSQQILFLSSVKGINSKMNNEGSVYSKSVFDMIKANKNIKEIVALTTRNYCCSKVYFNFPCWKKSTNLFMSFCSIKT